MLILISDFFFSKEKNFYQRISALNLRPIKS